MTSSSADCALGDRARRINRVISARGAWSGRGLMRLVLLLMTFRLQLISLLQYLSTSSRTCRSRNCVASDLDSLSQTSLLHRQEPSKCSIQMLCFLSFWAVALVDFWTTCWIPTCISVDFIADCFPTNLVRNATCHRQPLVTSLSVSLMYCSRDLLMFSLNSVYPGISFKVV